VIPAKPATITAIIPSFFMASFFMAFLLALAFSETQSAEKSFDADARS
jgi:hypothetical protein